MADIPGPQARIAGKYTWKTNLWGIGLVMWCLITRCEPPTGPKPRQVDAKLEWRGEPEWRAQGPLRSARLRAGWNRPERQAPKWTYGKFIYEGETAVRYEGIDRELRELVMRCMMDDPADRPEIEVLRGIIRSKISRRGWRGENSNHNVRSGPKARELWGDVPAGQRGRNDEQLELVRLFEIWRGLLVLIPLFPRLV